MGTCDVCNREFPDDLLMPFSDGRSICPLCALKATNKLHGLPLDTPFQGDYADYMWQQARRIYPEAKDD